MSKLSELSCANADLEIAHVFFIDIIGYSKLPIDEQRHSLHAKNDAAKVEKFEIAQVGTIALYAYCLWKRALSTSVT